MEYNSFNLTEQEFEQIKKIIYDKAGIFLKDTKKILVITRLQNRLQALNLKSFTDYINKIKFDQKELDFFTNAITTNETYFFRIDTHFDYLKNVIIPELEQKNIKTIRIWSAASSTGEEAYSLYLFLLENLKNPLIWDIQIEASDINTEVLEKAKEAIYSEDRLRRCDEKIKNKYFEKIIDTKGLTKYKLKNEYKAKIKFKVHNLKNIYSVKGFDMVFLRNVMIYFDQKMKELVLSNVQQVLKPNGYLFLGHSEGLIGVKTNFEYIQASIYRYNTNL